MNFKSFIWILYLLVYPFYVFSEGSPQIADAFGVLLIMTSFKNIILNITNNTFLSFLLYFVVYTIIVNTIWMLVLGDILVLKNSLYYLYAFLMLMFFYLKLEDENFAQITLRGIFFSLLIQLALFFFIPDQGVRTQMFFNNPNQLSLWGLCIIIIANALNHYRKEHSKLVFFISLAATFFIILSASRSGFVCAILFWLFYFFKSRKNLLVVMIIGTIFLGFLSFTRIIQFEDIGTINYIIDRLTGEQGTKNDSISQRGFERILEYPEYLILGAGEGDFERFNQDKELHSTFLNILFSYGLIGLVLFCRAILKLFVNSNLVIIFLFAILFLFGHVHMTLRIPLYWMSLAALYFVKVKMASTDEINEPKNQLIAG